MSGRGDTVIKSQFGDLVLSASDSVLGLLSCFCLFVLQYRAGLGRHSPQANPGPSLLCVHRIRNQPGVLIYIGSVTALMLQGQGRVTASRG